MNMPYKETHYWLIIPFVVTILGFLPSYWVNFFHVPWRQHLHGLSATCWFILLIAQPYLVSRRQLEKHRLVGMLGLFLAGGVVFSALGALPHNLVLDVLTHQEKYGITFADVVLVAGFSHAVLKAVIHRKNMHYHATWMISTVFWIFMPGIARLILWPQRMFMDSVTITLLPAAMIAGSLSIMATVVLMIRTKNYHPAYMLAIGGNLTLFFLPFVGNSQWWTTIADSLFTLQA